MTAGPSYPPVSAVSLTPLAALEQKCLIATTPAVCCVCCGSEQRSLIGRGHDYEYETCGNVWLMWQCKQCSHLQMDPRPADETLAEIYPPHYYSYQMSERVSPFALWAKRQLDRIKFRSLLRTVGYTPESFLDVGCGDGRYLHLMLALGLTPDRVSGLELDERAVQVARRAGLNVQRSRVEDASHIEQASIDLITMFHVIEHVAQPENVIRSLSTMLSPGGCIAIETPNFESLDARLFAEQFWGGYHFPRHWHIFTPASLKRLLERQGLTVESIRYQTGHSFWLFSFHHALKYRASKPSPRLAAWVHPFRNVLLLAAVTAFDLVRGGLGWKTSSMLIIARKQT